MKTILEFIDDYCYRNSMINESFKSSILSEIATQFNDRIKKNKEINTEKGWNWKDTTSTFKRVFGNTYFKWSEITDNEFKEYSKDDEDGVKLVKQMLSDRKTTFDGIVILLDDSGYENAPKYAGAIIKCGYECGYISFSSSWTFRIDTDRKGRSTIKPSNAQEYLTNKFLLANLDNFKSFELKNNRSSAKMNAYLFDNDDDRKNFYSQIAKQNRERYNRYLLKIKAEKESNDGMTEKIEEYTKKILDIVSKMSNNPLKYAKFEFQIGYLLDSLNDKRCYVNGHGRQAGYYSGSDGLLTLYKNYITAKLSMAKGTASEYDKKNYEAAKNALTNAFNIIDKKIQQLEDEFVKNGYKE